MNKTKFAIMGMAISLLIVLLGLLVLTGAIGGDPHYASSASYPYDSGYASFGADFYTYVTNNAEEAASAARTIASNLRELNSTLKIFGGILIMSIGLLAFCRFGLVWVETKKAIPEEPATESEPLPENYPVPPFNSNVE